MKIPRPRGLGESPPNKGAVGILSPFCLLGRFLGLLDDLLGLLLGWHNKMLPYVLL